MDNFAKEFMTHLNGKVSDDELAVILRELEVFLGNYDNLKNLCQKASPNRRCFLL